MTFALLGVAALIWSLTVLRWSISRRDSPWGGRAMVVSIVAGVIAAASVAADLRSIWLIARAPRSGVAITINDNGEWWQLAYRRGGQSFVTANEIHVPAGAVVAMEWNGPSTVVWRARDFLPHEMNHFAFIGERAEDLTVLQLWPPTRRHLRIVVDPPAVFDAWFKTQTLPTRWSPQAVELFTSAGCAYCHVIRGVAESPWKIAPELTHFASRRTIAGTGLPNDRGSLSGWVVNSKALKYGSEMPENNVQPAVLHQLVTYLGSLR